MRCKNNHNVNIAVTATNAMVFCVAHMLSQHGTAPPGVKVYSCSLCNYKCIDKNRFEEHDAMHTGLLLIVDRCCCWSNLISLSIVLIDWCCLTAIMHSNFVLMFLSICLSVYSEAKASSFSSRGIKLGD